MLGGAVMLTLIATQLIYLLSGFAIADWLSIALVLAIPVVFFKSLGRREFYLMAVCGALAIAGVFSDQSLLSLTHDGLSRSAYLASFILLMAMLREGAVHSDSVRTIGAYLTKQPSSRRFLAIFSGAHFLGVLINLGSLALFAPIIQRGVRAELKDPQNLDDISVVRERRQLSAAFRGFSWFLLWAPTAVTQAVMPTLMDGIDALRLMGTGLALALLMTLISWAEDSLRWRPLRARLIREGRLPTEVSPPVPFSEIGRFAAMCAALIFTVFGLVEVLDMTIIPAVMCAAPVIVALWVMVQNWRTSAAEPLRATVKRLGEISFVSFPGYSRETVFIACAGFIGTVGGKLVPAAALAAAIDLENLSATTVLLSLTASVWVMGLVGLSPITMAIFLASLIAEVPQMPVDVTWAALAIAAGTAVCTTGAPFSSGAVLMSRISGISPVKLTLQWNGAHTVLSFVVLGIVYFILVNFQVHR